MLKTPLCESLGIEHPVFLAGMGGVAYAEVCAAVSEAGGLGTLGMARPVHRGKGLDRSLSALVARADTFFIASQFSEGGGDWTEGIDVSHRGGPPGFVLVAHETALLFPDYSGNCMFNTLGNLLINPRCGLLFVDFDSGDTLQLTGEAEILMGPEHTERFPGARRTQQRAVERT